MGVQGAGEARRRRRDAEHRQLVARGVDPRGARRHLVVADGMEDEAESRVGEGPEGEDDHQHGDGGDVVVADARSGERLQARDPQLAAREVGKGEQHPDEDERKRERGERQVRAAQPQAEIADAESDRSGDERSGADGENRQEAKAQREQRARVGARAEEERVAEVHLPGVSRQEIPAGGESREDAGHRRHPQHVRVRQHDRED